MFPRMYNSAVKHNNGNLLHKYNGGMEGIDDHSSDEENHNTIPLAMNMNYIPSYGFDNSQGGNMMQSQDSGRGNDR